MNAEIAVSAAEQLSVVLTAFVSGFVMGLYYDFFRVIRKVFRCGKIIIIFQDLFFWITSAIAVFYQSISLNAGFVRISFIVTVLLAWFLYFLSAGRVVMFMVNISLTAAKRLFSLCYKRVIAPAGKVADKIFMLISQKITKILTHMTKNTKINKKC